MSGLGHNRGPAMGPGHGWRRHCWRHARAALMPKLPLEVVRRRVARAAELGLDYSTYAGLRATTGRDIVAVLFSTNALRMHRAARAPAARRSHLAAMTRCDRVALAQAPLTAPAVAEALGRDIDRTVAAPGPWARWAEARSGLRAAARPHPADAVVLVGATGPERGWSEAAGLAGYLDESAVFPAPGSGAAAADALGPAPSRPEHP